MKIKYNFKIVEHNGYFKLARVKSYGFYFKNKNKSLPAEKMFDWFSNDHTIKDIENKMEAIEFTPAQNINSIKE